MKNPQDSHFTFQMYEVQEKCRMCSLTPHTDDTHYAAVLSLNHDEEMEDTDNGTAFWRHVEYDEEFVSSDKNYRIERLLTKQMLLSILTHQNIKLKLGEVSCSST